MPFEQPLNAPAPKDESWSEVLESAKNRPLYSTSAPVSEASKAGIEGPYTRAARTGEDVPGVPRLDRFSYPTVTSTDASFSEKEIRELREALSEADIDQMVGTLPDDMTVDQAERTKSSSESPRSSQPDSYDFTQ